jgi:hypothetical protein
MPRNLRKALSLTAFLFLLAALFPIQKQTISQYDEKLHNWRDWDVRQLTFFWQSVVELNRYPLSGGHPFRNELDWDSCTLEGVIIVSIGFLYFGRLEGSERKSRLE